VIVEVIAVGTELLLGQIINSNGAEIGSRLAEDGFDSHFQVTVGDNIGRLVDSIRTARDRADAVVLSGGIGPTQDDLTRDAICRLLGVETTRDEDHAAVILGRLSKAGVSADSALRMADYPQGSEPLPNRNGVALGIAVEGQGTPIFAVPGVPSEMRVMMDEQVRPRLRRLSGEPAVLASRVLRCWGQGEARIAEMLDDLYACDNPSIAFLISDAEVTVRISAKASTLDDAVEMIDTVEAEVRDRLGDLVFAMGDQTVEQIVSDKLSARGWTIASVEGPTSGLLAARLSRIDSFSGGVVLAGLDAAKAPDSRRDSFGSDDADVVITVEGVPEQPGDDGSTHQVRVSVRTPLDAVSRTLTILGDHERLLTFAVPGALHVLRQLLDD
jgi:competence/damage-inducible protein CinA-like protein